MRYRPDRGFALFETLLCLALLGVAGSAAVRTALAVGGAVAEGRRWSDVSQLGKSVLTQLEVAYRQGAPSCVPPAGGSQGGRGVVASWAVVDAGAWIDIVLELKVGSRPGAIDTVFARVGCR